MPNLKLFRISSSIHFIINSNILKHDFHCVNDLSLFITLIWDVWNTPICDYSKNTIFILSNAMVRILSSAISMV